MMSIDSSYLKSAVDLVELLTGLEYKWKTGNTSTRVLIMKLMLVELFVDTKKQFYIQEKELFEIIKIYKNNVWYSQVKQVITEIIAYKESIHIPVLI